MRRIIWPILIGLGVIVYMLYRDISEYDGSFGDAINEINWTGRAFMWLGIGLVMMVLRDVSYMAHAHCDRGRDELEGLF
ncbi:MAG: hypothetical protein R3B47_06180 [Bacteroidia bacterium]